MASLRVGRAAITFASAETHSTPASLPPHRVALPPVEWQLFLHLRPYPTATRVVGAHSATHTSTAQRRVWRAGGGMAPLPGASHANLLCDMIMAAASERATLQDCSHMIDQVLHDSASEDALCPLLPLLATFAGASYCTPWRAAASVAQWSPLLHVACRCMLISGQPCVCAALDPPPFGAFTTICNQNQCRP